MGLKLLINQCLHSLCQESIVLQTSFDQADHLQLYFLILDQMSKFLSLCLLLFLCFEYSVQKTCFQATQNRITSGQLNKYLPAFKKVEGLDQRQYVCTKDTDCFQSSNQFFYYYGLIKTDPNCMCEQGFIKECTVEAHNYDNIGIKSTYKNGKFTGNQQYIISKVRMVFSIQAKRIGSSQVIHQWYLRIAYPIK